MKIVDWLMFGIPTVLLLGVSIGVMFLSVGVAAKVCTWLSFAGFAAIFARMAYLKLKS